MHIVVCMKQVPDPEGPKDSFVIDKEKMQVVPQGIPPVLSLFDENALEAGLRLKDVDKVKNKVTILTVGNRISTAVVLKALSVGADELVKVEDDLFESGKLDSMGTAAVLAAAVSKMENVDIILVGRQSADWNAGVTGIALAQHLKRPVAVNAMKVETDGSHFVVDRVIPGGQEKVKLPKPAVVLVSNEIGELRYPTMLQRKEAKQKPVQSWKAGDIAFDRGYENRVVLRQLYATESRQAKCNMIEGATAEERAKALAAKLHEDRII